MRDGRMRYSWGNSLTVAIASFASEWISPAEAKLQGRRSLRLRDRVGKVGLRVLQGQAFKGYLQTSVVCG